MEPCRGLWWDSFTFDPHKRRVYLPKFPKIHMINQVAELELLWWTEDQRIRRYAVILISFPIVTNQIGVIFKNS
jgi:hypothetical protein